MFKFWHWLKTRRNALTEIAPSQFGSIPGAMDNLKGPLFTNECQTFGQRFQASNSKLTLLLVAGILSTSCSYKSPTVENPVPSEEGIDKSFFVTSATDPKTGKQINIPKTFLCGWASEMETGWVAENNYSNNVMVPEHCNLAFEITENQLVGKLINPSFPTDPSRWELALTIPIASHYYLENEKDSAGRDTKKVIKNTSRSHWSARPQVDLNFQGINLDHKWSSMLSQFFGSGNLSVEKIEWDKERGFLGFTVNKGIYGSQYNKIRFNILAFDHNPEFKKTPFNDQDYKKMNVLHIVGEKVNGLYQILHAAHWDLTKTHEIRLYDFPEAYKPVVKEVIKDWNDVLRKIGAAKTDTGPFIISDEPAVHPFDLRYPTIAWISDEKISSYSALGVGMALADVKNGEIQWGMITLYGGGIETYMKAFTANSTDGSMLGKIANQLMSQKSIPQSLDLPAGIKQMAVSSRMTMSQAQSEMAAKLLTDSLLRTAKSKKPVGKSNENERTAEEVALPQNIQKIFGDVIQASQAVVDKSRLQTANQSYLDTIKQAVFPNVQFDSEQAPETMGADQVQQKPTSKKYQTKASRSDIMRKYSGPNFCQGRTFADMAAGWAQAKSQIKGGLVEDKKILIHMIKELITHEYGHFLGLGHQFKENILPAKGSVPDKYYMNLAAKASPEKGFTNYTSVMGYRNPRTEVADSNYIKPGPQDELVLRFLYRQQYSTYRIGDTDFTFMDVPANGIIPDQAPNKPELKTSYFPQCNDMDASYSLDPYCNRFDRGYSATTIVKNYFSDLTDTTPQNLFAFSDARGGCPECIEGHLWYRALTTMSRTRLFYDYMRLYFKKEIDRIRTDEDALLEFSNACRTSETSSTILRDIFNEKPQLKELCQANGLVLDKLKELVSLDVTDFTKKDLSNRFAPGGLEGGDTTRDWSRFTGSWTEMTGLPLKLSALFALSTGVPWISEYLMFGVPLYDDPNFKFAYSSLYPKEYTDIIAANVRHNLHFASLGKSERTSMGSSISSMGWLNYLGQAGNNDAGLFPPQYIEKIRNQQKFDFGVVALILSGHVMDNSPTFIDSFAGTVYDFSTSKSTPLTNAYLLPGGVVIADASNMFLYPISRFTPFNDTEGYVLAYKLDYFRDHTDPLSDISVKTELKAQHDSLIKTCIMGTDGANNGLAHFFSGTIPEFKGFKMTPGIAREESKRKEFLDSIDRAYSDYYTYSKFLAKPKPETCREAVRGLGLIMSTAAVINGFWLPEVSDYIQK